MKRVLVVITTAFVSWGGLTNAFMNYYRKMDMEGLCIDIASMNEAEQSLLEELSKNNGRYCRLPDKRTNTLQYLKCFFKLCKGYDVVHVHGNSSTMAGELLLAKIQGASIRIAHCHTNKCIHPVLNSLCTPALLYSQTMCLAVSEEAAWVYGKHSYTVLKNTIDTDKFSFSEKNRKEIREKYGISRDEIVIGHCGKIYEAKNHQFLVRVFAKIHRKNKKTKLFLVGDGVLRKQIEQQIQMLMLDDYVIFAGMQSDTSEFYSAMDYFMFPSIYEGFGLALLEAQAAGLQCIASEYVPVKTNVTGNVKYLKLDEDLWEETFNKSYNVNACKKREENAREKIVQEGYDSYDAAQRLKSIYLGK